MEIPLTYFWKQMRHRALQFQSRFQELFQLKQRTQHQLHKNKTKIITTLVKTKIMLLSFIVLCRGTKGSCIVINTESESYDSHIWDIILLLLSNRALYWFTAVGSETIFYSNRCYKLPHWLLPRSNCYFPPKPPDTLCVPISYCYQEKGTNQPTPEIID